MTNGAFAEGVAILAKYVDPEGCDVSASHDKLWFGPNKPVSRADAARLRKLGWTKSKEGGWSCFT